MRAMQCLLFVAILGAVVSATFVVTTFLPDLLQVPSLVRDLNFLGVFVVFIPAAVVQRRHPTVRRDDGPANPRLKRRRYATVLRDSLTYPGVPAWAVALGNVAILTAWLLSATAVWPERLTDLRSGWTSSELATERLSATVPMAMYTGAALMIAAALATRSRALTQETRHPPDPH